MASYNTVITNEGAALLASVIANQGTITFSEMRFSTTDYDGVEQTLTVGTFAGVFITAAAGSSKVDTTTIKVAASFDNSGIVGDHPLYSIGIVGTDGNTTALIAVCTTTTPDIIRTPIPATSVSRYGFNTNLTVSSTSNITVVGTTALVLYDSDVVDTLTSPATNKPLSANQGRLIADNLAANENVYGAKQMLPYPFNETTKTENAITFTDNGDGTITVNGIASNDTNFFCRNRITDPMYLKNGTYKFTGCPSGGGSSSYEVDLIYQDSGGSIIYLIDVGNGLEFTVNGSYGDADGANFGVIVTIFNGANLTTPVTFYPMLRDARIIDPTFAPYAETNLQLTQNKAERNDLATLNLTGSTNTTGAQIDAGTFFYLNGQLCKALANIAANATFTLNTNYKETTATTRVFTKLVTATTNSHGEISLKLNNTFVVLATIIETNDSETYVIPRGSSDGTWYAVCFNNGAVTQATIVTVKVYYISI